MTSTANTSTITTHNNISSPPKKKRRKTFTGCWTCRARKVKCDTTKPECLRCQKSKVKCKGYGLNLIWQPLEGENGVDSFETAIGSSTTTTNTPNYSSRRKVAFVKYPSNMVYTTYDALDNALSSLSAFEPSSNSQIQTSGPFGVFRYLNWAPIPPSPEPTINNNSNNNAVEDQYKTKLDTLAEIKEMYNLNNPNHGFSPIDLYRPPEDNPAQHMPPDFVSDIDVAIVVLPTTRYLLTHFISNMANLMTVVPLPRNPWVTQYIPRALKALGDLCSIGQSGYANHCTFNSLLAISAFHLRNMFPKDSESRVYWHKVAVSSKKTAARFMIRSIENRLHVQKYKEVVVSILIMAQIDVTSGQMSSCGLILDLCEAFVGSRNTSLSEKAKMLHRIYSFYKMIDESTQIFDTTYSTKDYESFIDGMNQVIGDEDDNQDSNNDLIPRESKSFTAHYYNTNCLFESGVSRNEPTLFEEPSLVNNSSNYREQINDKGRISIERMVDQNNSSPTIAPSSPPFIDLADQGHASPQYSDLQDNDSKTKKVIHDFSTDALFGLPKSIIRFFQELVRLFRFKMQIINEEMKKRESYSNTQYHDNFKEFRDQVSKFESDLSSWSLEWDLWQDVGMGNKAFRSPTHKSVYHHLMSFKDAIFVYFYRIIKRTPYSHVEKHIIDCVNHLISIGEDFKLVPIFWPAFIVACETSDVSLQQKILNWCNEMAKFGISDYHVSIKAMQKVWENKKKDENYTWIHLANDYDVSFFLL